jgi:endogenous inhibitor of DNA gyrase (YacG/DUF329 family)
MIVSQVVCDRCGTVKKDANHWFASSTPTVQAGGIVLYPIESAPVNPPPSITIRHLCSERCVLGDVADWMAAAQKEPQK